MTTFTVQTRHRSQMIEVTDEVKAIIVSAAMRSGEVIVHVPHTTAGITINENADPDVVHDILEQLDRMVPWNQPFYRHAEGNSASHIKASMIGSAVMIFVEEGRMVLGRWQGVYFCEFDGPRSRQVQVQLRNE